MGINSLNKFIRNNCPEVYEQIHISEYSFKKVAIDISLYLCKFKTIYGDDWLSAFLKLITCLRKNEVHCVFIYDSGAPPEKEKERQDRREQREKTRKKVSKLEYDLDQYHLTSEISNDLLELWERCKKSSKSKVKQRLLNDKNKNIIDMSFIEDKVKKMRSQILEITTKDFDKTKELFNILNVPYYNAPLEAETMCSDICKRELVDAVLSEDTDVLAYGAPVFISKINTTNGICVRINYENLLKKLELKSQEFLDLCIMCGTDYNKNIFRVGPEKSYKYIKQYSSIENIANNTKHDISILSHKRGRELFTKYEQKDVKINYCGVPDFKKLVKFIDENGIECNINYVRDAFVKQTTIVLEED